jgi:hypothetical protein
LATGGRRGAFLLGATLGALTCGLGLKCRTSGDDLDDGVTAGFHQDAAEALRARLQCADMIGSKPES